MKKYFENFNIPPSKLSIYSYLQHYGAPSPYIDFSTNITKAIYFGIEKYDDKIFKESNTIDDYFSLFFIQSKDIELIEIPKVVESIQESKNLSQKLLTQYEDYSYDIFIEHLDKLLDINTLNVYLIDNRRNLIDVYNTYNNIRIIAQEGLFISNIFPDKPLEEALKEFFKEATYYQHSLWDEEDSARALEINEQYVKDLEKNKNHQNRLEKNIIISYEIKKKLIPGIRALVNIDKKEIYPNPEDLVWTLFEKSKTTQNKSYNDYSG